jgi:hypothetical protein
MSTQQTPSSSFFSTLVAGRQQVAIGLAVAGVVLAGLAVWFGVWGFARNTERPTTAAQTGKIIPEEFEKPPEESAKEAKSLHSSDYQIASIWAGGMALLVLLSAGWVFTQPVDSESPEVSVRKEILVFGGVAGLLTTMGGVFLGYRWHQSLIMWVGGGDSREAKWVLYAAAVFLAGLLIMFASLQLARTEQRTNAALRRVLYGFNAVFVGLLLLLVLTAINVIAFIEVPATLNARDAAFTGLSDESKRFLHSLDRPVHVYLIMPESHRVVIARAVEYTSLYSDCRGLLSQCEEESRNFHPVYLSPAFDRERIATLMQRLNVKEADRDQIGMLATVGDDESAYVFIPDSDLVEIQRGQGVVFQGENKLMTELMFLTDVRGNQKIYFIQGFKQLGIDAGGDPAHSASQIVQFLRDRKMNVEALDLSKADAKIPDDAGVVVVAGPRETIPAADSTLTALRDYLRRPDNPGKLIAFLPAFPDREGRAAPSGLEQLFVELGVQVDRDHRLVSAPQQVQISDRRFMPQDCVLVGAMPRIDISLGRSIGKYPLIFQDTRDVRPGEAMPGVQRRAIPLLGTGLITWREDGFRENLATVWASLRADKEGSLLAQKQVHLREAFPVAVAVVETSRAGDKTVDRPRAIVFGSDSILIDQPPVPSGIDEVRQQLFSDCIDWLRERDSTQGIPPRKLPVFVLEKPVDWTSQVVLLLMIAMGIAVVGGGVWLSRRR